MLAKIIDTELNTVNVFSGTDTEWAISQGFEEMEVELAYNGSWYVKGYAPEKPQEVKEQEVRAVRAEYFEKYVDFYQSKPLYWAELPDEEKQNIANYRKYLQNYTDSVEWYEKNPLTYNEWLEANRLIQAE